MSDTPVILPDDPAALKAMIAALQAENARIAAENMRVQADIEKISATLRAHEALYILADCCARALFTSRTVLATSGDLGGDAERLKDHRRIRAVQGCKKRRRWER